MDGTTKTTTDISIVRAIGHKIKMARLLTGKKQAEIGELSNCSYQQLQKYETGANRVTADRLLQIARATNQPPAFFFEDLRTEDDLLAEAEEGIRGPMVMEFVEALAKLNTEERKTVMSVIRGLAKE